MAEGGLAVAAGVDTVSSLLGLAGGLVTAILQAREEVRRAPEWTQELLRTADDAQSFLIRLEQERPLWGLLERQLRELAKELVLALEKLQQVMESDARRQTSNQVLETAKAFLKMGARRQNKETVAIIQRLQGLLQNLDRAVLHDMHALVRDTHDLVSGTLTRALLSETDGGGTAAAAPVALPHPEHALVTRLLAIAAQNSDYVNLKTEVFEPGRAWRDPVPHARRPVTGNSPANVRRWRAAREGGYEVPSSTKVRFTMSVGFGTWSFYVLTYDGWENTEPQVFFPKTSKGIMNKCNDKSRRVFPNPQQHFGDPISLKVERSRKITDNGDGQVSIFLVLSTAPLHTGGAQQITVQDIEEHMGSAQDLIVKHVLFDVSMGQ